MTVTHRPGAIGPLRSLETENRPTGASAPWPASVGAPALQSARATVDAFEAVSHSGTPGTSNRPVITLGADRKPRWPEPIVNAHRLRYGEPPTLFCVAVTLDLRSPAAKLELRLDVQEGCFRIFEYNYDAKPIYSAECADGKLLRIVVSQTREGGFDVVEGLHAVAAEIHNLGALSTLTQSPLPSNLERLFALAQDAIRQISADTPIVHLKRGEAMLRGALATDLRVL